MTEVLSVAVDILLVAPELALEVECLAALVTLGRPQPLVSLVDVLTQVGELLLACGTLVLEWKKIFEKNLNKSRWTARGRT